MVQGDYSQKLTMQIFDLLPSIRTNFDYTGSIQDFHRAVELLDGRTTKIGNEVLLKRWNRTQYVLPEPVIIRLKEFLLKQIRDGKSIRTLSRLLPIYRETAFVIAKPTLEGLTRQDFDRVAEFQKKRFNSKIISESTMWKNIAHARILFQYLAPEINLSDVHIKVLKSRVLNADLLTDDEFKRLIDATDNARDRGFIMLLYESGCRVGELLNLRIKDVTFDQYGAILQVNGKTGARSVRVVSSTPLLSDYLQTHPNKKSDSYFWYHYGMRGRLQPMTYAASISMIQKFAKKAGITKRIHPHLFRHGAATRLSTKLSNAICKQYLGWGQSSLMLNTYINLGGGESSDEILRINGILKDNKTNEETTIAIRRCIICKTENDFSKSLCKNCGRPLTPDGILKQEQEQVEKLKAIAMPDFEKLKTDLKIQILKELLLEKSKATPS